MKSKIPKENLIYRHREYNVHLKYSYSILYDTDNKT